jgi:hypothetical protein
MPDLRDKITTSLQDFRSKPLRQAALSLLDTLGYRSDRTLDIKGSKHAFLDLIASQGGQTKFDESKALFADWKSADILFQLSDADISRERSLFKDTKIQPGLLQSYLFFAIDLKGRDYARGKLSAIARQINRVFPMPVMVLFKHGTCLSIAVINRRQNKVHTDKDVLEKVTLIRDISLTSPHRGHLDILQSFSLSELEHPKKLPIRNFDSLHAAWEQIFNVELLNARFYKELANWYFWALPQVEFPADLEPDDEKRRATGLIRLLTRLIFCWFLKEKDGLIPEKLFHPADLAKLLKGFDPESETSSTYYLAILQNLFFATLNQRMGKDGKGNPYRFFATDEGFHKNRASYNEETKTTARKQTGSFYTPRPIVDYMVDESLKAHLEGKLTIDYTENTDSRKSGSAVPSVESVQSVVKSSSPTLVRQKLDHLFTYTEERHQFTDPEVATLITAIDEVKILDPASGSGAFPMGGLHKLVYLLSKLDPENVEWEKLQIAKVQEIKDTEERRRKLAEIASNFADNNDDYGRKLYLIENCLYGVDIQPIAIQITKLRFFISLVCDQKTNRNKKDNHGIRPLPNLETKFVAADTLIGLPEMDQMELVDPRVYKIEADIETLYHSHFSEQRRDRKLANQRKVKVLRKEMADVLAQSLMSRKKSEHIAEWDPFDPQSSADFFDPHWMFGKSLAGGFDIVIGNPPYGATLTETARAYVKKAYKHQDYQLDSYLLFFERGISLLRQDGVQSFIVPNTWLPSIIFKSIRRFIFGQTRLTSLVDIRTAVFTAVVDNNIITHSKSSPEANRFPVVAYTEDGFAPIYIQQQEAWHSTEGNTVSVALTPKLDAIADVIRQHETLDHFFTITPGCKPYQVGKGAPKQTREIVSVKPFTSEKQESPQFRPLLRGRLITQYKILWNKDLWINFGEWLAEPRVSAQYDADEKIVIRQTGDSLIAALDSRQFVVMNNMFTIVPKSRTSPLRFALSAINSSVLNWYYQNCINPEKGEALAEVKKGHLTQLPLAVPSPEKLRMFDALVTLIIFAKADAGASPGAAAFLKDLIDACVMECYCREHMAERDLLFHDTVAPHLAAYAPEASAAQQRDYLTHLHQTLNAASHPIRNRLLRLTADSPDLLAIIKQEGKV